MLGPQGGWLLCSIAILLLGIICRFRYGSGLAVGLMVITSFAIPVWAEMPLFGLPFNIQTTAAALSMLLLVLTDPGKIRPPLVLLDLVLAAIVVLQFASDVYHNDPPLQTALLAYGEWILPYVAGRFAIGKADDLEIIVRWICGIVIFLSILAVFEAVTSVNPWELVFGLRPEDGVPRTIRRLGLRRAHGPTTHPLFFGSLMMVLAAWPVVAASWSRSSNGKTLAGVAIAAAVVGCAASVSRAPLLGCGLMLVVMAAFWWRPIRWVSAVALVGMVAFMAYDFNSIVRLSESMVGENQRNTNMVLDGEKLDLSSAKFRIVQLQVMMPAYRQAGLLGYGTRATDHLPPDVPFLPKDEKTRHTLRFVDNAYLMYGLRFGWTGTALFIVLLGVAAWSGIHLYQDRSVSAVGYSMTAMTVALSALLWTVFMSYDFGFEVLWSFGVMGGLIAQEKRGS